MREHFPILNHTIHDYPLIYLDNAATMQMPDVVIERIKKHYQNDNANIHRGIHTLSEISTREYEAVREVVREFLDAESADEIIFTAGTTASINMAAQMLEPLLLPGDEILVTRMEHHSNLLPWMELAKRKGLTMKIAGVKPDGTLDLTAFMENVTGHTKVVAFTEISNVTGIRNPLEEMIPEIRARSDAYILVDGAQGVVHGRKSIRAICPDFYCFSGHKLGAPTGTGILYVRNAIRKNLRPVMFGGGTVHGVTMTQDGPEASYLDGPSLFEPGTPNVAGVIGFGAALKFWMEQEKEDRESLTRRLMSGGYSSFGMELLDEMMGITQKEANLLELAEEELMKIPGVHVLGAGQKHYGCLSFVVEDIHSYDICRLLDRCGVAVRSGHMCAQPYLESFGYEKAVRISVAPYNTRNEIEEMLMYLRQAIEEVRRISHYKKEHRTLDNLDMKEAESVIRKELLALKDPSGWLIARGAECMSVPEQYRQHVYEVLECQVNTVMSVTWMNECLVMFADSESAIIKGILALIQEIYMGRKKEEILAYNCCLLDAEPIRSQLDQKQYEGLIEVIKRLKKMAEKD